MWWWVSGASRPSTSSTASAGESSMMWAYVFVCWYVCLLESLVKFFYNCTYHMLASHWVRTCSRGGCYAGHETAPVLVPIIPGHQTPIFLKKWPPLFTNIHDVSAVRLGPKIKLIISILILRKVVIFWNYHSLFRSAKLQRFGGITRL